MPPTNDLQEAVFLCPGILAQPVAPLVEFRGGSGGGEPTVGQNLFLEYSIVLSLNQQEGMVGPLSFAIEEQDEGVSLCCLLTFSTSVVTSSGRL